MTSRASHRWMLLLGFIFSFLSCGLAGCGGKPASESGAVIYGRASDANTLDPINTDIGEAVKVVVNVFDTLVAYDDHSLKLVPSLATHWTTSEDGRVWTFTLRDNVKFHDGTPLDAAAVVASMERMLRDEHPLLYDPVRPYRTAYNMVEAVTAPNAKTVVFTLKEPNAVFLNNLAMFSASIVSPTAVKEKGKQFATQPVGSGPFRVARWVRDQQIVLEANAEYWNGKPKAERIVFVPVSDSVTRVTQLKQGRIHLAEDLPPVELDALESQPGITIHETPGLNVGYLTMQMDKPPLNVLKVRQAIGHAIDKRELVKVVYAGRAKEAVNIVPQTMWGHHDELPDRAFDVELAKRLLDEAATENKIERPIRLSLAVMNQARPYMQQPIETASFLKDSLAKIGIEVTVEPRPTNLHFPHLMAGKHQLGLAGWTTDNSDPDNFLFSLLDPSNIGDTPEHSEGNNLSRYRSDEFRQLMAAGQRELDEAKRREIYHRAQALVLQDAPVIPLVHCRIRVAVRSNLQGYTLHPTILPRLRHVFLEGAP